MLNAAEIYNAPSLRTAAIGYIAANAHRIEPNAPKLLLELTLKLVSATDTELLCQIVGDFVKDDGCQSITSFLDANGLGTVADNGDLFRFGEAIRKILELRRRRDEAQAEIGSATKAP